MERRYDASIAGSEPVYQPPKKAWALSAQAKWLSRSTKPGAQVEPMPGVAGNPTLKDRVALRREIIQALEHSPADVHQDQWIRIFSEAEPLLGAPTVDMNSDSPGGRKGSWIHEILLRAAQRPEPKMIKLVSGLLSHWVSNIQDDSKRKDQWSLLVPSMSVMETWRPELADRFDFLLIDAARSAFEQSLAELNDRDATRYLESFNDLLIAGEALNKIIDHGSEPVSDQYFTQILGHLRLQVSAIIPNMEPDVDIPHPLHLPVSFRYGSSSVGMDTSTTWKTGACSVIDCFERSLVLRTHMHTHPGAFNLWSGALLDVLKKMPVDQHALPLNRIEKLSQNPTISSNPGFAARIRQTLMLMATPEAPIAPRPNPRF